MQKYKRGWLYHRPTKGLPGCQIEHGHPCRIFEHGEWVPEGWEDSPDKFAAEDARYAKASAATKSEEKAGDLDPEGMDKDQLTLHAAGQGIKLDQRFTLKNMLAEYRSVRAMLEPLGLNTTEPEK